MFTEYIIPVLPDNIRTFRDPKFAQDPKPVLSDGTSRVPRTIIAFVKLCDVPDFPISPDPRLPNEDSVISRTIRKSALSDDGYFHELNRGITLCVREAEYDNRNKKLTLDIPNEDIYGILDGGHTHRAIRKAVNQFPRLADDDLLPSQYVRLEIMVGIEDRLTSIAAARNLSAHLKDASILNHAGKFDWFLHLLGEKSQHVIVMEGGGGEVRIEELAQVVCAVNPSLYPDETPPLEAYKNAGTCLRNIADGVYDKEFDKMENVIPDIVKLYDYIRMTWDIRYDEKDDSGKRGNIQNRAELSQRKRNRESKLTFYFYPEHPDRKDGFPVEKGLAIPVISSFRAILERDAAGNYAWKVNPYRFFDLCGTQLVREVMEMLKQVGRDAHLVGRDKKIYTDLFRIAKLKMYEIQNNPQILSAISGSLFE